jgi:hypothetical protein
MTDFFQPWYGMRLLIVACFSVLPAIFYGRTLSRTLNKCSRLSRALEPGVLWLLFLPFVNLLWNFIVVLGMANSLKNEFSFRNTTIAEPAPGRMVGIAMSVCGVCTLIPNLGIAAGLAQLVFCLLYWVKISEFSRMLDRAQAVNVVRRPAPEFAGNQ